MKKWIIRILILFFVVIIILLWGNDEQNLGDDYYYLPDYEAIDVGYPGGPIIYKSQQKYLYSDIKLRDVVDAISNSDFVIASQKKDSFNFEKDSLQYYIIVKKTDSIYGPYDRGEYLQKREKLNIPKKLILKE